VDNTLTFTPTHDLTAGFFVPLTADMVAELVEGDVVRLGSLLYGITGVGLRAHMAIDLAEDGDPNGMEFALNLHSRVAAGGGPIDVLRTEELPEGLSRVDKCEGHRFRFVDFSTSALDLELLPYHGTGIRSRYHLSVGPHDDEDGVAIPGEVLRWLADEIDRLHATL
jgi:hypothetical protein